MKRINSTNGNFNSGKTQVKSNTLPTCAFCKGAGEPINVYTSHWQFSQPVDGKLTCPKLLNYCCTNCHTKGHIEKRCPFPKARAKVMTATKTSLYCKFCDNARKADYTTHNQFDKDGFVQCPVLLNIECQLCGLKGHTKRYCSTQSRPSISRATKEPVQNASLSIKRLINNKFSVLEIILSDEEEEVKPAVEKKQQPTTTAMFTSPVNSWAGRVATGITTSKAAVPETETETETEPEPETESCNTYTYNPQSTSWADSEW